MIPFVWKVVFFVMLVVARTFFKRLCIKYIASNLDAATLQKEK